jgi:putative phosphoesterase
MVEFRKIAIEHDALSAKDVDGRESRIDEHRSEVRGPIHINAVPGPNLSAKAASTPGDTVLFSTAMRIAVLSDTHDRYPPSLPERLREADEIWHLGDVCDPETLVEFGQLGPPLHVVRGNCDGYAGWPLALGLEREGVKFFLTHIPPEGAPAGVQAVLHGHTHVPRDETLAGVRWLNPGCITRPNAGAAASFAWLTVERGQLTRWELMRP